MARNGKMSNFLTFEGNKCIEANHEIADDFRIVAIAGEKRKEATKVHTMQLSKEAVPFVFQACCSRLRGA